MKRIAPLMLTISLLPVGTACAPVGRAAESGGLVKTAAYEITNVAVGRSATWTEANDQIMAAKRAREARDLGSMVRIYIRNEGEAASLKSISWGGKQVDEHAAGPDYQAIWWRLNPWAARKGSGRRSSNLPSSAVGRAHDIHHRFVQRRRDLTGD